MARPFILVSGDQTVEQLSSIRNLVQVSRSSPFLQIFLQHATDVIQAELAALSAEERHPFFGFDTLLALAEEHGKRKEPEYIVATCLTCIARLGELIIHVEKDPNLLQSRDNVYLLGFGAGLLPLAVLAAARDTSQLLRYGLQMVAVSLRLGHEVALRAKRIEEASGSWAYELVGVTSERSQTAIDEFVQTQGLPDHRRPYVSVSFSTSTTIYGPPSVLAQFWPSISGVTAQRHKLAIGAAVHAPHLPSLDMDKIAGSSALLDTLVRPQAQIYSSSTCKPYVASDLRHLLHVMIQDIAKNTSRIADTIQSIVSDLRSTQSVDMIVVGSMTHVGWVQNALQDAAIKVNLTNQAEALPPGYDSRGGSNFVAIVGMSGRFPGGDSLEEFWEVLRRGQDLHRSVPESRFDTKTHVDPSGVRKNTSKSGYGCFLDNPGLFDSHLFNVSPREAAQMDPLQRLLMMTSYEALEMAGYSPGGSCSTESKRIATYIGQTTEDWRGVNECQGIDIYYIPGTARAFAPGRLNYHFKWGGATYSVDAACASSSTAIALACSALIARECDTALAGGGSILSSPANYAGLSRANFLSNTGGCKTFHDDADGYCRGEGIGAAVLKRLEDAKADNDNILAVIKGFGRNYSSNALSITRPSAEAQSDLYKQVLRQSGTDPRDVGYVEMHGTGTQPGDTTEMHSVLDVFGKGRTSHNPLVLGAVKANIGHGEAAAGITSLIKTVKILLTGKIPPQPCMPFERNRKFPPLEDLDVKIAEGNTSFKTRHGTRQLLINNFDAAGGNTCLLLEQAPQRPQKGRDPRSSHVVACSARTAFSLMQNKQRLLKYLTTHREVELADLAYTTTARRLHHVFQASYAVQTTKELVQVLASDVERATESESKIKSKSKGPDGHSPIVFAFTGQGSLYLGMGKGLFQTCPRFRASIRSYQEICDCRGLPQVIDLIASEDEVDLESKTMVEVQLATVFLEMALADLWRSWGVEPDLLIGHSLGEYTALYVSEVLSISDVLYLVGKRSLLMQERCSSGSHVMLAVGSSPEVLEDVLATQELASCQISCRNAPNKTVVSGLVDQLNHLQNHLQAEGIPTTFLRVPYGFHSSQVDVILGDIEAAAGGVHFAKPQIPIASTLTGSIVEGLGEFTPSYLARQAREPVKFVDALRSCAARVNEQTLWIEIGPKPTCLGFIRSCLEIPSARLLPTLKPNEDNWKTITTSISIAYMSKIAINWVEYHREHVKFLSLLDLPTYAFDVRNFWSPYKAELLGIQTTETISENNPAPSRSNLTTCLQQVVEESFQDDKITITFMSHTSEPNLYHAIQGHLVDNIAICPTTILCDMAFTAAKYIHEKTKPKEPVPIMSLWNMDMTHPLVVTAVNVRQIIFVTAIKGADLSVNVSFKSEEGSCSHEHGGCQIRFSKSDSDDRKAQLSRNLRLVKRRTDHLIRSAVAGRGHRLMKPVIYKLFASFVRYSDKFQGLEEVFLDNEYNDAVATVKLTHYPHTGNFTCNPFWLDAIIHVAGFLVNSNFTKPDEIVFICIRFEVLQIFEDLSKDTCYTSYVSMQEADKQGNLVGDIHVFHEDHLVAICAGVFFQKMTRNFFAVIVGQTPHSAKPKKIPQSKKSPVLDVSGPEMTQSRDQGEHRNVEVSRGLESTIQTATSSKQVTTDSADNEDEANIADVLLAVVASETGVELEDMDSVTLFLDLGVDSLMSIAIISAVKAQLEVELPASLFIDHPTVLDVTREFGRKAPAEIGSAPASASEAGKAKVESASSRRDSLWVEDTNSDADTPKTIENAARDRSNGTLGQQPNGVRSRELSAPAPQPRVEKNLAITSNVVLIQGRASNTKPPLFLITDGAGSAAAYIHLPPLTAGQRIYAVESPLLKQSQSPECECSVEELAKVYGTAIKETQPQGPYLIGGWSAGAVYSYEVARQFLERKEEILALILIDMRIPEPLPHGLELSIELVEKAGLFTGINRSRTQKAASEGSKMHFVSTVRTLVHYEAIPMDTARRPGHSFMIWARRGLSEAKDGPVAVLNDGDSSVPEGVVAGYAKENLETGLESWAFGKRTSFGANGWDRLVGNVECSVMDGDHFSIVTPPDVNILGKHIKNAVDKAMLRQN